MSTRASRTAAGRPLVLALAVTMGVVAGSRVAVAQDAGVPAPRADAGPRDAGPRDAGLRDAGPSDAGPRDAGPARSPAAADAGSGDASPTPTGHGRVSPRAADPAVASDTDAETDAEADAEAETDAEADAASDAAAASDADADADPDPEGDADLGEELFPEDADVSELLTDDMVIPDVVVTASAEADEEPADTGGAVQHLDERQLSRFRYDNPEAVIQQVPGAYFRSEDGFGLRPNIGLRGVNSDRSARITLLEDGVLFGPAPYAAPAAYYFPIMSRMTGVDVYMGAATVPYGPMTVGGAINLRGRDIPRAAAGGLDMALGTNLGGRVHMFYGGSNEWGGLAAEGVYVRSDGFKTIDGQGEDADSTGFDRGELLLRGELHGGLARDVYHRLELRVGLAGEGSNETYLGLSDEDFREDPYRRYGASSLGRMNWWRSQVQLRHTLEVGDGFTLRTIAYRHDLDRAWNKFNSFGGLPVEGGAQSRVDVFDVLTNPGPVGGANQIYLSLLRGERDTEGGGRNDYALIGTNYRRFGVTGLSTDALGHTVTGDVGHRVRGGVRLHHDEVFRHHTEDAFRLVSGAPERETAESYTTLRSHAEALALSAYFSYALTLFDAVTLSPGVRTELIWTSYLDEESGAATSAFRPAVLPGASVSWKVIDELTVFGGVMRGFAPVAPGQAAGVSPEESINYELGARFEHRGTGLSGQATGFVNDYQNLLSQCSFSAGCADEAIDDQANAGAALVAGFDARIGADVRFDGGSIPLRVAYTYTYGELLTDIEGNPNPQFVGGQAGDRLPYLPEHQVSAQAGIELREFGLNVSASYVTPMWEAVAGEGDTVPRTDEVFLLDATAYLRLFEPLTLYVRGENLTDTRAVASRRPLGARPSRPLQVLVGLRLAY